MNITTSYKSWALTRNKISLICPIRPKSNDKAPILNSADLRRPNNSGTNIPESKQFSYLPDLLLFQSKNHHWNFFVIPLSLLQFALWHHYCLKGRRHWGRFQHGKRENLALNHCLCCWTSWKFTFINKKQTKAYTRCSTKKCKFICWITFL